RGLWDTVRPGGSGDVLPPLRSRRSPAPRLSARGPTGGSGDPGEEGYLHLLRAQPAVLPVQVLNEAARLVPEDRFAIARQDDHVTETGSQGRRRLAEDAGRDQSLGRDNLGSPVQPAAELLAHLVQVPVADVEEQIATRAGRRERLSVGAGLEPGGELGPDAVDVDRASRVDRGHS